MHSPPPQQQPQHPNLRGTSRTPSIRRPICQGRSRKKGLQLVERICQLLVAVVGTVFSPAAAHGRGGPLGVRRRQPRAKKGPLGGRGGCAAGSGSGGGAGLLRSPLRQRGHLRVRRISRAITLHTRKRQPTKNKENKKEDTHIAITKYIISPRMYHSSSHAHPPLA